MIRRDTIAFATEMASTASSETGIRGAMTCILHHQLRMRIIFAPVQFGHLHATSFADQFRFEPYRIETVSQDWGVRILEPNLQRTTKGCLSHCVSVSLASEI
jgi:hypothetical protein